MSATATEPKLLNARQAATVLGLSIFTVRRAAADGSLPAVRLRENGRLLFRVSDLEALTNPRRASRAELDLRRRSAARGR